MRLDGDDQPTPMIVPPRGILGTVAIETHGCKLNQADSEALARRFVQAGYRLAQTDEPADVYVVNTCTVTHVADRKARHGLRAARRHNPTATIIATGCYAQRAPTALAAVDGVDLVVGNSQKDDLVEMVLAARGDPITPYTVGDEVAWQPSISGRTRAMVKIQEGCNQVCAYCIVPKVRGRERSIPADVLVEQVNSLVRADYMEVVLTGTQLGSYGFDLLPRMNLPRLIERILSETTVPRLRVSSLQPQELTAELLELWGNPRLCPHFHMPLQSGSDSVLKRMRRRYSTGLYASVAEFIRSKVPGASITTDVIAGFPGESDEEYEDSVAFARTIGFSRMHVFPYSLRPGTSAAYLGGHLDALTKRSRMDMMLKMAEQQERAFVRGALGTLRPVLWERTSPLHGIRTYLGLTDTYLKVIAESDRDLTNRITPTLLLREEGESIRALVMKSDESP